MKHCSSECRFRNGWPERGLSAEDITGRKEDLQAAAIFPVVEDKEQMGTVLRWMVSEPGLTEGKAVWLESRRLSADEISAQADLRLLYAQRESFCKEKLGSAGTQPCKECILSTRLDGCGR